MLDLIDNSFPQDEKSGKKKKKQKLAKELSRCVNYVSSVGFKGFEHAKQNSKHFRAIFNLSVENNLRLHWVLFYFVP